MDMLNRFIDINAVEMVFHTKKGSFHALRDIKLSVKKGEFVTLIGHSGCGKSTLLNLIAGWSESTSRRDLRQDGWHSIILPLIVTSSKPAHRGSSW